MKRLALSVVGGFVIPFLYTLIVGPLTNYIESYSLRRLAEYPVRWPVIILQRTLPFNSFVYREEELLVLIVIGGNVFLYSVVTYFLLWRFWKPKTKAVASPPEPPQFESPAN